VSREAFNNLHVWAGDAEELAGHRYDLQGMADWLEAHGYYLAARHTREVLRCLAAAEQISEPLRDVWYAADSYWSGDTTTEEHLREAAAAYQPWPPPPEET
jgi:hypothetical protein